MKFLVVTNHSYMLWQFRHELIAALKKRGEVVICTPFVGREEEFETLGCRCIEANIDRRGINPLTDSALIRRYGSVIRCEKPDIVITYSIKPNIYVGFLCRKMKVPYCVNVQGLGTAFQRKLIAAIVTFMYRVSLKKARAIFFENEENANEFVRRKIVKKDMTTVLHGAGVNLNDYASKPYPAEDGEIRFLYLGRIMREKGMDEFFAAARSIKEKYGDGVKFDLVGFFEDDYKPQVEELTAEGVIEFHGFHEDPRPFYENAHCIVLPSYHEGMSNVLLEGASTGRALIATDIPGCREAVDDGITGFLCKKMDAVSLEKCLERFIALTEQERILMGARGRSKMEREFDKKTVVEETLAGVFETKTK